MLKLVRSISGSAVPIRFEPPVATLPEFLDAIARIAQSWQKKTHTWSGDRVKRKGEEERLWLRGQPAAAKLSPRIYRAEYLGPGRKAPLDLDEPEIRQQFQSRAIQLASGHLPEPERIWDWYFLMQHYGAPTRLLDWTDLPLVSLYFAVTSGEADEDVAVWVMDPYWLNHKLFHLVEGPLLPDWLESEKYLKKLEDAYMANEQVRISRPAAIDPPHVDRRLSVQGSHFVIFGKSRDLAKSRRIKERRCRLAKIPIPADQRDSLQEELEALGITRSSVFPDLEALGQELSLFWKLRHK